VARIAVGGFHHETNTFAAAPTTLHDFATSASYPHLPRGAALPDAVAGQNLPVAGFIETARSLGHEIAPLVWAGASPAAAVTDEAFETVAGWMLDDLRAALPVDAVYLCLHGAMVTASHGDGEAELLRRVRGVIGDRPLVASLDFHANVSAAMVDIADAMVAFRTYPHVDMAETGARAARMLDWLLVRGFPPAKAWRPVPFLIPLVRQCTLADPARALFRRLEALEEERGIASLSFTLGFPLADVPCCGPAVLAYGDDTALGEHVAAALHGAVLDAEPDFAGTLWEPEAAVRHARAAYRGRPIVLADTQDNPGAGAASDTTGLLRALVAAGAEDAALAILVDPAAAAAAHRAGPGAELTLELGEGSGQSRLPPFAGTFRVEALSDGRFPGSGRMSAGLEFQLGPTALLRTGGVRIVVASRKTQANDQAIFRHIGIDPAAMRILALKSSVHFRDDFQELAGEVLVVEAPGPNLADHCKLPYRHLRPDLRLMPLGPAFGGPGSSRAG
jgi:microcystin degradation protein MlrC